MLAPLIFAVFIWLHDIHTSEKSLSFRLIDRIFFIFLILIVVGSTMPLILERTQGTAGLYWKSSFLLLSGIVALGVYQRYPSQRLLTMIVALLLLRIGFNWFVLPDRNAEDWGNACRMSSIEAARQEPDKPLFLYKDTELQMTNAFYLTNARQQIIHRTTSLQHPGAVYILAPEKYPEVQYRKVGEFFYRHGRGSLDLGIPVTK